MIIEITGVTNGVGPYDIYLCNWDLTGCFYISGVTSIPPNVFINSDNYFPKEGLLKVRIVDNYGCVDLIDSPCEPTPTPTPTATPTPTPVLCSMSGYSFELNKITPTSTPTATPTPTPTPTIEPILCSLSGYTFELNI